MGSNHGNLLNELNILVRGRHGVLHVIVNIMGVVVGDDYGYRSASGAEWSGCDDTGEEVVGRLIQNRVDDTGREGWEIGHSW